jgi:hypothetical protein
MRQKLTLKMGLALILLLVAVTGCGRGGLGGSVPDVTGSWEGGLYQTTTNFRMMSIGFNIVESSGFISGTGSVQGSGVFTVEGSRSARSATIRFHLPTESNFIVLQGAFTGSSFRGTYTQRGTTTPMTEARLERR